VEILVPLIPHRFSSRTQEGEEGPQDGIKTQMQVTAKKPYQVLKTVGAKGDFEHLRSWFHFDWQDAILLMFQ